MERRNWPWKRKPTLKPSSSSSSLATLHHHHHGHAMQNQHDHQHQHHHEHEHEHHHGHSMQNGQPKASPFLVSNDSYSAPPPPPSMQLLLQKPELGSIQQQLYEAKEEVELLTEKLSVALSDVAEKQEIAKQVVKTANEALSAREKVESEAITLRQQLEEAHIQRINAESHNIHLDGALKECMRQVRQIREEHEQKIQEAISHTNRDWEKIKAEMDAKCGDLQRCLLALEAENKAMSKSLQERARAIMEANDSKVKAETEVKLLQVKVDSLEKDISGFKYEIHLLNKETLIRNEEKEYSKRAAETAHKQHLDNVKKIAKLESECQRLRGLLRKRLPGPATLAQMKMESDPFGGEFCKPRRRLSPVLKPAPSPDNLISVQQHPPAPEGSNATASKEIEVLLEKLVSVDEETKLLKEVLAKRTAELQSSRQLCARTATKLAIVEQQLESFNNGHHVVGSKDLAHASNSPGLDLPEEMVLLSEPSVASRSDTGHNEDEEAESWASALIAELALFKDRADPIRRESMDSLNSPQLDPSHYASPVFSPTTQNPSKPTTTTSTTDIAVKITASTEAAHKCQGIREKLSLIREHLKSFKSEKNAEAMWPRAQESVSLVLDVSEEVFQLEKALDGLSKSNGYSNSVDPVSECFLSPVRNGLFHIDIPSPSNLGLLIYKLVRLFEDLAPSLEHRITSKPLPQKESSLSHSILGYNNNTNNVAGNEAVKQLKNLVSSKEEVVKGKSSVMEFLLRLTLLLCYLAGLDSPEISDIRSKIECSDEERGGSESTKNTKSYSDSVAEIRTELELIKKEKEESEANLASTSAQLETMTTQLSETKKLVSSLQGEISRLQGSKQGLEGQLTNSIADKRDLESRLQIAQEEISQLRGKMESLADELEQQKRQHEESKAKYELELQQQLLQNSSLASKDVIRPMMETSEDAEARSKKERDITAAKEKLAECQRTIAVLGEQLKALDSPADQEVTSVLCSAESMGSAEMRAVLEASSISGCNSARANDKRHARPSITVHEPRGGKFSGHYNNNNNNHNQFQWSPSQYLPGSLNSNIYTGNYNNNNPMMQLQQQQNLGDGGGYTRWAQPELTEVKKGSFVSLLRSDNSHYPEDGNRVGSTGRYSPPDTASSSPARSPARFLPFGNRRTEVTEAVRMDLSKNMNLLLPTDPDYFRNNSNKAPKSSSSGLGRLFSRSKNHR